MAKKAHVKVRFTTEVLGMSPSDPEVYTKYIMSKADNQEACTDEPAALPEGEMLNGITVFLRDGNGNPCFADYQIKGFFKETCSFLSRVAGIDPKTGKRSKKEAVTKSGKLTAHNKVIDGNVFVSPRFIPIHTDHEITICERPLRAMTAQGPRIALAASEQVQAGAWMEFDVIMLNDLDLDLLLEWLEYGKYHGFGQWRNSGKGSFVVEECRVTYANDIFKPSFAVEFA